MRVSPTQIFFKSDGKEAFRHEGFFGKEDILAKWKELGVDLSGSKPSAGIIREVPVKADTRSKNEVCFMCDGDVNLKTLAVVKGQSEERRFCSPHCYFIYLSSIVDADEKAEDAKVSVTDWVNGNLIPAAAAKVVATANRQSVQTRRVQVRQCNVCLPREITIHHTTTNNRKNHELEFSMQLPIRL